MLFEGPEERAAQGLLAAFAWAAPDIARITNAAELLETVADVIAWQGYAVLVFAVRPGADAQGSVLEQAVARPANVADRARLSNEIRIGGELAYVLVVEGSTFTRSAADAIAAFARLAEATLAGIAHRDARARSTIARERLSVLGEAAAVLAHEMRNPLGTISNALALLEKDDPADRAVALPIVRDEVGRLDSLVQDLLQLARPIDPAPRRVQVRDLVSTTLDRARKELEGKKVVVPPSAGSGERIEVTGDPALLGLALENLLRNAAQASPPDSEIRVVIAACAAEVTLSVEDDGPGVDSALQERIFEPFFTTRAIGTGLGLSIVKRLVEAHGGSVRVGASPSGGARFDLVFARSR